MKTLWSVILLALVIGCERQIVVLFPRMTNAPRCLIEDGAGHRWSVPANYVKQTADGVQFFQGRDGFVTLHGNVSVTPIQ